jgi:replication factor A1
MKLDKNEYYNLISDLMTQDEFEEKIKKFEIKFSGLIDENVIAHLIVDELGRNVSNFKHLVELRPGMRASLFAIVTSPIPKIFQKHKGTPKAAEVFVSDLSGRARLLLWDPHHVELVENGDIKMDTKLKLLNVKISKSSFGLDLTLDRFDALILNPDDFPERDESIDKLEMVDITSINDDGPINVIGTISWKSQLRTFNRKNKSTGSVLNLELYDGTGSIRVTLWDEHALAANELNIGEQLKIIDGYSKMHENEREIHSSYRTKLIRDKD